MKSAHNSGKLERKELFSAAYGFLSPIYDPPGSDDEAGLRKKLFDQLLRFDKAAHLEAFVQKTLGPLQRVDSAQFQRLVKLGQAHTGLSESAVRDHFTQVCRVAKVNVAASAASPSESCVVCAYCAALNASSAKSCAACQQSLFEECANCGAAYLATLRHCPSCATSDAASVLARSSIARGGACLAALDLSGAQEHLQTALRVAPLASAARQLADAIMQAQRKLAERGAELDRLIAERQMHTARQRIRELAAGFGEAERTRRQQAITSAIERADALTTQALQQPAQAINLLGQALAIVADHIAAHQAVARMPPPGRVIDSKSCAHSATHPVGSTTAPWSAIQRV
jgi:tetratricopeptide (TPR) repeat protein